MDSKAHINIEELKKNYIELQNRERKFREMIEMLPETVYELDLKGNLTFVNDAGLKLFGYSRKDFDKGLNVKNLFLPHEIERIKENISKTFMGLKRQSTEYMAVKRDGTIFPVLTHSRLILKGITPVCIRGILIDLTESYKVRRQLEREKDFVNSLLDTANSLVICLDTNENIIMFNKECEKLTGYKLQEVRGKNWPETFIPEKSRRKSELPFSEWIKIHPEDRYEAPLMTRTGEIKNILWSNTVFSPKGSDEIIALAIGHDITEQMIAIRALQESESHYRAVWDSLPVGICLTDRDGVYRYVNPVYCKIYGYKKDDFIGRTPDGLIFPDAGPEERKRLYNERFDNEIPTPLSEHRFVKSDGSPVWVEVSSDFIRENGKPKYRITVNIDITSRKSAESALIESEHRYDLLFQNVSEAATIVNQDGVFEMMNITAAAHLGAKPEDFIGKKLQDVFPADVAERQMANTLEVINKSKKKMLFQDYEFGNNGKQWFKIGIYPVKDRNNIVSRALLVAHDVTDEVRRETMLKARFRLLDNLRKADCIDECLKLGCKAMFEAELYRRSVLTLHNEKREITNLGQMGLENKLVKKAKEAKAPSQKLAKKIMRRKFKISKSYFIPDEAGLNYKTTKRYIPSDVNYENATASWKGGDELFVPVLGTENRIEGWLSVDTPFDGKRPSYENIRLLEEITDIVTQRAREILYQESLIEERKALEEKNVAMREILEHIEDEKAEFKQRLANNIDKVILPALGKISLNTGGINEIILNTLRNNIKNLASMPVGIAQLYSKLSPREIEICNMIKANATSKEIADSLNITLATVSKHRESIRRKLGLTNRNINLTAYLNNLK